MRVRVQNLQPWDAEVQRWIPVAHFSFVAHGFVLLNGRGAHQGMILRGAGCEPHAWQGLPALTPNQYGIARQAVTVILLLTALFMSRTRSDTCCP